MPCFRDEDLVLYAEGRASPDLIAQIQAHLEHDHCRLCGGFVEWLQTTLPQLAQVAQLTPADLVERTIPRLVSSPRSEPLDVELAQEVAQVPVGVRNLASDLERVYQVGRYRLEIVTHSSLDAPFLDLVGLLEPTPPDGCHVLLLLDGLPIEVQALDAGGRFRFARLVQGVYQLEVEMPGEGARRTPPIEVKPL